MKTMLEGFRTTPVIGEYDVAVLGGGTAGVCAAVCAARSGVKVALLERYGWPGGLATGGLVLVLNGMTQGERQIIRGFPQEIVDDLAGAEASQGWPQLFYNPEVLKYILDCKLTSSGVNLYLHTLVVDAIIRSNNINHVIAENKSGRFMLKAKMFVDATGDGDTAKWCDLDFVKPDKEKCRPVTGVFRAGNVNISRFKDYITANPEFLTHVYELDKNVVFTGKGWHATVNPGEVWFDSLYIKEVDITNPHELGKAELTARKCIQAVWPEIKAVPGFEAAYLQDTAAILGGRESRHVAGQYTLSANDAGTRFPDTICLVRSKQGTEPLALPYRCLLPHRIGNLLYAGRCVSVADDVYDVVREIAPCMAMGQAAGVAAAMAVKQGVEPARIDLSKFKAELQLQGVVL